MSLGTLLVANDQIGVLASCFELIRSPYEIRVASNQYHQTQHSIQIQTVKLEIKRLNAAQSEKVMLNVVKK
jgi:hypothetical protein